MLLPVFKARRTERIRRRTPSTQPSAAQHRHDRAPPELGVQEPWNPPSDRGVYLLIVRHCSQTLEPTMPVNSCAPSHVVAPVAMEVVALPRLKACWNYAVASACRAFGATAQVSTARNNSRRPRDNPVARDNPVTVIARDYPVTVLARDYPVTVVPHDGGRA